MPRWDIIRGILYFTKEEPTSDRDGIDQDELDAICYLLREKRQFKKKEEEYLRLERGIQIDGYGENMSPKQGFGHRFEATLRKIQQIFLAEGIRIRGYFSPPQTYSQPFSCWHVSFEDETPLTREYIRSGIASHTKFHPKEITLSSGKKSDFYINMRSPLGFGPNNLKYFGQQLKAFLLQTGANVYAGPAAGSISLMTAAVLQHQTCDIGTKFVKMCYTRSATKEHGLGLQVEGPRLYSIENNLADLQDYVILVDDVLTTGGSLIRCADALSETCPGIRIVGAWVCVDREEGGKEALQNHLQSQAYPTIQITSVFKKSDFLKK